MSFMTPMRSAPFISASAGVESKATRTAANLIGFSMKSSPGHAARLRHFCRPQGNVVIDNNYRQAGCGRETAWKEDSVHEASKVGSGKGKGAPQCGAGEARLGPTQPTSRIFSAPPADLGVPGFHSDAGAREGAPGAIFSSARHRGQSRAVPGGNRSDARHRAGALGPAAP